MTDKKFFPSEEFTEDKLRVEIPPEVKLPQGDKIPNGYDPMGHVYLEGRAYRGFGGGNIPWWVIISGWFIFGGLAFLSLGIALDGLKSLFESRSDSEDLGTAIASLFPVLIGLVIGGGILLVLWKGTKAKLARKSRNK